MPARSGRFSSTLRPFGGGTLNLDAAYAIEPLTATPSPPDAHAPPPLEYGSAAASPWDQQVPIVGTTPVPPGVLAEPAQLQPWQPTPAQAPVPMTLTEYNAQIRAGVIDRAQAAGIDYNTATVNQTVANDYARYVAAPPPAPSPAPTPPPPAPSPTYVKSSWGGFTYYKPA